MTGFTVVETLDTVIQYGFQVADTIFSFVYIFDVFFLGFTQCHVFHVCGEK